MGVAQSVIFEWCHGHECERIPAEIRGTLGYWRTYSRKHVFWQNPQGSWTVDVLTPQGQLLKRMRFAVTATVPSVTGQSVTGSSTTEPAPL
jgi:hypothetical protein